MTHAVESERRAEWGRSSWIALALLLALQWLVQGAEVLALADVFHVGDAIEKGAGSKALVDGLGVPRHWLVYHDFEGGGFVSMHLVALSFALFGQTLLASVLAAVVTNSVTLALGFAFCRDAFGRAAAVVFGLLFVLQPESFQKIALIPTGSHYHGWVAVPAILLYSSRIAFDGDRRRRTWLALGLALGFGFYLTYQNVVPIAAAGVLLLARAARDLVKPRALFGWAGLVVGLAPWLWMLARLGTGLFEVHGAGLGEGERVSLVEQQRAFLASIWAERDVMDLVTLELWTLVPLTALAVSRAARPKALQVAACLALFAAVYLFAGFAVGEVGNWFWFNRTSPFLFYAMLLSAAGLGALLERGGAWRRAGWALLALFLGFGAREVVDVIAEGSRDLARNARVLTTFKGYQYVGYLKFVAEHVPVEPGRADGGLGPRAEVLLGFDEADPALLRASVATGIATPGTAVSEVEAWLAELPADARADALLGLGPWWLARHGSRLPAAGEAIESAPPLLRDGLFEAVGRFGASWLATERRLERELAIGRERGWPDAYYRGLGYRLSRARALEPGEVYHRQPPLRPYLLDPDAAAAFLARQAPDVRALLEEGYARALADHSFGPDDPGREEETR